MKTNASTQFKDAACASLKAGDSVEVKGARQTDNSVLAKIIPRLLLVDELFDDTTAVLKV